MKKIHSLPVTFIVDFDKEPCYYVSQIKEYPQAISQDKIEEEEYDFASEQQNYKD